MVRAVCHLCEESKEIVVAAKKDVQAHFDVVSILVFERAHFATDELPRLVNIDLHSGMQPHWNVDSKIYSDYAINLFMNKGRV